MNANEIRAAIEELQLYFSRKCYGWTKTATPDQLQQYADRSREYNNLVRALDRIEGENELQLA